MNVRPATTPWLRRARWAVGLAAAACVGLGLHWVYRAALAGDVSGALAGTALCLGVLALDYAAAAVLRMGGLVLRSIQRIENIEHRLSALEVSIDALEHTAARPVDLTGVGTGDATSLVAAQVDRDVFPRLAPEPTDHTGKHAAQPASPKAPDAPGAPDAAAASIASQRELDQLVRREMDRLRAEFAELVRQEDYAAALRTGQRIETLFPDSALAEQFQSIQPHLLRRAAGDTPQEPASAM